MCMSKHTRQECGSHANKRTQTHTNTRAHRFLTWTIQGLSATLRYRTHLHHETERKLVSCTLAKCRVSFISSCAYGLKMKNHTGYMSLSQICSIEISRMMRGDARRSCETGSRSWSWALPSTFPRTTLRSCAMQGNTKVLAHKLKIKTHNAEVDVEAGMRAQILMYKPRKMWMRTCVVAGVCIIYRYVKEMLFLTYTCTNMNVNSFIS